MLLRKPGPELGLQVAGALEEPPLFYPFSHSLKTNPKMKEKGHWSLKVLE